MNKRTTWDDPRIKSPDVENPTGETPNKIEVANPSEPPKISDEPTKKSPEVENPRDDNKADETQDQQSDKNKEILEKPLESQEDSKLITQDETPKNEVSPIESKVEEKESTEKGEEVIIKDDQ